MADINEVVIVGTLSRDAELKQTSSGKQVVNFQLACNEYVGGNQKEKVHWLDFMAWEKVAENICRFAGKGSKIIVKGRLNDNRYTDATTGKVVSKMVVNVREVQFLTKFNNNGYNKSNNSYNNNNTQNDSYLSAFDNMESDSIEIEAEDLPF